jgi:GxxExxY protein
LTPCGSLIVELRHAGLRVDVEVEVPLIYRGLKLDCGYKLDLLVEDTVILELKTVSMILAVMKRSSSRP